MQNDAKQHILLTISHTHSILCVMPSVLCIWVSGGQFVRVDAGKSIWDYPTQPTGCASHWTLHFCPQQSHNFQLETKDGASPTAAIGELCSSIAPCLFRNWCLWPHSPKGLQHPMAWTTPLPLFRDPQVPIPSVFYSLGFFGVEDKPLPKPGGFIKSAT